MSQIILQSIGEFGNFQYENTSKAVYHLQFVLSCVSVDPGQVFGFLPNVSASTIRVRIKRELLREQER